MKIPARAMVWLGNKRKEAYITVRLLSNKNILIEASVDVSTTDASTTYPVGCAYGEGETVEKAVLAFIDWLGRVNGEVIEWIEVQ